MKIQNRQVIDLFLSLKKLDGEKLDISGEIRWKLAKNFRLTKVACKDYDKAIVSAQEQHGADTKKLAAELETIQSIELDLPLLKIKLADLNLDTNKSISAPTLEGLMHIIDE
jgi:hypothetical protein